MHIPRFNRSITKYVYLCGGRGREGGLEVRYFWLQTFYQIHNAARWHGVGSSIFYGHPVGGGI